MILKFSKPRKQVVLSGNVFELVDVFMLTSWMIKADFQSDGVFDGRILSPKAFPRDFLTLISLWSGLIP